MNRLTESMREQWVEDGYLHLKNVVGKDEVATCLAAADDRAL